MGAPLLCGCDWPEINWIASSGLRFRPQEFETYPKWGATVLRKSLSLFQQVARAGLRAADEFIAEHPDLLQRLAQ